MKLQIMAAAIAAIFLSGCGGSSAPAQEPAPEKAAYRVGVDITENLQASLDADCQVTLPRGEFVLSAPVVVRGNNCGVTGSGSFNGGTTLHLVGDGLILQQCQHCYIRGIYMRDASTGYAMTLDRTFLATVDDVRVDDGNNGILTHGATETTLRDVSLRNMAGEYGVRIMGDTVNRSYRTTVSNLRADNTTGHDNITWLALDSYAYSLVIDKAALLNGGTGFTMQDTANTGDSYPIWAFAYDLELDHNRKNSALLAGGEGFYATVSWFGSNFDGACIHFAPTFRGEASISTSRVMGCNKQGVLVEAKDVIITGSHIGDNSNGYPYQFYDVELAGEGGNAILDANHVGDLVGVKGSYSRVD